MAIELKLSTFSDHVDTEFELELEDGTINLTMVEVKPIKQTVKGFGVPDMIRDDPFALLFRGPADQALPQRIYPFKHEKLGDFEMFIVPVGIDENGRYYEALVN